jgi:hypothetical protein
MDVLRAVLSINPKAQLDVYEENIKTINWRDGTEPIPEAEIEAEIIRLQAEYDSQEYARKRKAEYDALNQFELISDDTINGTTTHKDAIVAIKTKYPKG